MSTAAHAHLSLPLLSPESAEPAAAEILTATQSKMGMIPNMYRAMANHPAMLATYVDGYTRFRASGDFSAVEQEVVLLTISHENRCHYCVAAHSFLAAGPAKVPRDVIHAIRLGGSGPDARLAALSSFTRAMVRDRGHPGAAVTEEFLAAGFAERHVLAILLAISVKTISNYANHLFNTPVDDPFLEWAWTPSVRSAA